MPDISMCQDKTCPQRNKCYRFRAIPHEYRQSWFAEKIRDEDGCGYFMPIYSDNARLTPEESHDA